MPTPGATKSDLAAQDVDRKFEQIRAINRRYRLVVDRLALIRKNKKLIDEKMALITERNNDVKRGFIEQKQATRALIDLLRVHNVGLAAVKEATLKELQEEFRGIDSEFKELGVQMERADLMEGAAGAGAGADDPSKKNNTELLGEALDIEKDNLGKLKDGLKVAEATREQGQVVAGKLAEQREQMGRISEGLDNMESELQLSRKLLVNFAKRLATDKVIIAFTFLVVMGIVGIIVYASLNPSQKIFNVPDAAIIPPVLTTPTPSASPSPP